MMMKRKTHNKRRKWVWKVSLHLGKLIVLAEVSWKILLVAYCGLHSFDYTLLIKLCPAAALSHTYTRIVDTLPWFITLWTARTAKDSKRGDNNFVANCPKEHKFYCDDLLSLDGWTASWGYIVSIMAANYKLPIHSQSTGHTMVTGLTSVYVFVFASNLYFMLIVERLLLPLSISLFLQHISSISQ